ncbi:DNA mismatch repair protein MutS [Candidatus Amarolinea dominans]|uniref:DNA mismatch repair protein MutS n=1 Tax=Candidatus Amarolinea dominans TaxID=3140696 RepID=UPI003136CFC6|nr:DNA mismatch repair protein MutS [Anaerolineae bacterium]MBK9093432.1 DNA mismatch repair protein MutS [Anaerolineae bacterium]
MTMTTPMRRQYLDLKRQYKDTILFFRLGDFYETFDDDAKIVASVCDVVLTSRPVGADMRVPLAGVPWHSVDGYVARLIQAGYKVAIAEQQGEAPVDGLVPRLVNRIVSAGTVVEPGLLPEKRNNYLVAGVRQDDRVGVAYADITTGEFATTEFSGADAALRLREELARLQPAELLTVEDGFAPSAELGLAPGASTRLPPWRFELETARRALLDHFHVQTLAGFGCDSKPLAISAAGALLQYLREMQPSALAQLTSLYTYSLTEFMVLDEATRRNLELTESIRGSDNRHTLLAVLDDTRTPMGARLLRRRLGQPLLDLTQLDARLGAVAALQQQGLARAELLALLKGFGDLERWVNRVVQRIALPRDLLGIRQALTKVNEARRITGQLRPGADAAALLATLDARLDPCADVAALLGQALVEEPPATLQHVGIIRPGFSTEIDAVVSASKDAKTWVANLEGTERARTGIKSLKVGYNKVFGYYLEVSTANAHLVPADYIRKQTLVNAERYITPKLKEMESIILHADERQLELEQQVYRAVLDQVAAQAGRLLTLAQALAELDVYAALAEVAARNRYVRPELADDGIIEIKAGRHPVVELTQRDEPFVPNDVSLHPEQAIIILTGPNMAGKSVFLRQIALITLMAHIGSFVPADAAHIGLVDRVFTRVGAADDIARGQSTFMVEMVEAANILNHASSRSLLILDEIGRGTSTYDGMAIAWAIVEHIHNHPRLRAKTLFATHYHELTDLAVRLPHVVNFSLAVAEEGGRVVFLHKIVPGKADRSYGVHVAELAGLPRTVIARADEILADLEAKGAAGPRKLGMATGPRQLGLFVTGHPVVEDLKKLDVNGLSPLAALNVLFELQQRARQE